MTPLAIAACLAALGALCAWLALRRAVWSISIASVAVALSAVQLIIVAQGLPIDGPPPSPFVLYGAAGPYAWASPGRDASPRTYRWTVPAEMQRELRKGSPLDVEGEKANGKKAEAGNDNAPTIWRWTRLEPEGATK